ncbi:unnamed protein product [Caenorhabditis brenneri]
MKSSLCFLFVLAFSAPGFLLGDHAEGDPASAKKILEAYRNGMANQLLLAQLSAFAIAVHSRNMDDLYSLFNTTQEKRNDPDTIIEPLLNIRKIKPISASFQEANIKARMLLNEKINMEWELSKKVESPTGWTVSAVRFVKPSKVKKLMPDMSDFIYCVVDRLQCIGNTLAQIFG